jgi:Na+/H+-dicarboxylate symporter
MGHRLTFYILIGMILGVITGYLVRVYVPADSEAFTYWLRSFSTLSTIFLNLIKLVVAPLILGTLIAGIAHMGDSSALGRIGTRAIAWFILASLISISLGLIMVNFFEPGAGLNLTVGAHSIAEVGEVKKLDLFEFIEHVFPKNIFQAMADNNVLQILVFAVFGALAGVVAKYGLGILGTYAELVTEFYLSLVVLWVILLGAGAIFLGRRIFSLIRYIRQPLLIAFSTASSEAAMPKLFEQLDRFGVPRRISGFVLPLGYSFNLDGSMMYASFATLFIAQAYGIELSITQQILILLTLMVSSKGIAAVPRASLVVITATLAMFDLPVEGVALIFAIDQFLDMGRTATNVVGNAVATSVITKWEGMLEAPEAPDLERPHAPAHTPHHGTRGLDLRDDIAEGEKKPAADNA